MESRRWADRLSQLTSEHRVPGAQLAVFVEGVLHAVSTGLLNVETGVEVTDDSVFQIGSVTKAYTTTLVMQLAEEGSLGLEQSVMELLPELRLDDATQAGRVKVRHLLCHTSGIQGDFFEDSGRGDDALERYVRLCEGLGFSHPVGETMSYCNTALCLAGRIIEKVTGKTWDDALRTRLLQPLNLDHTVTLPEDALRFRVAHGHVEKDGVARLAPQWGLPRALGPAGLICSTAADVVSFARMHLAGGADQDGRRILSGESISLMRAPQVELPDRWTLGSHWGIGWELFDWQDRGVFGHDGNSIGQAAYLRVVPDRDLIAVLLTNGGHSGDLYQELFPELLRELADIDIPAALSPPPEPRTVDAGRFAGTYEREGVRMEFDVADGHLRGRLIETGPLAKLEHDPVTEVVLTPVSESVFLARPDEGGRTWTPFVFYELDDGSQYLHMAGRATPRTLAPLTGMGAPCRGGTT